MTDTPVMDQIADKAVALTRDAWDQVMHGCDKKMHRENWNACPTREGTPRQARRLIEVFLRERNENLFF